MDAPLARRGTSRVDAALARLHTTRVDAALALGFMLAGLVQVVVVPIAPSVVGEVYVVGTSLPLAWRRTRPIEAALASSVFWLIPLDGFPVLGFVVVILQFYGLGSHGSPRRVVALVTVWAAVVSVFGTLLGPEPPVAAIGAVLAVAAPVLAGQVVAQLQRQNRELARLTHDLTEERRKVEEAAVGAERARIAQELHDVVGHEVTLIAIQAEAASAALRLQPERAAEPVEAIRVTAHRTLAEIRSVLDVLAPATDRATYEDLRELAGRAEAAGIPNDLVVTGEPWPEQSPASLAVNRIVRECLTNAGRHAPGERMTISVDWKPDEVRVHATNTRRGASMPPTPGRGLTGIRHRAALLGGTFDVTTGAGTFEVTVTLPAGGGEVR